MSNNPPPRRRRGQRASNAPIQFREVGVRIAPEDRPPPGLTRVEEEDWYHRRRPRGRPSGRGTSQATLIRRQQEEDTNIAIRDWRRQQPGDRLPTTPVITRHNPKARRIPPTPKTLPKSYAEQIQRKRDAARRKRRKQKDMFRLFVVSRMQHRKDRTPSAIRNKTKLKGVPMLMGDSSKESLHFTALQMMNLVNRIYADESTRHPNFRYSYLSYLYTNTYSLDILSRLSLENWKNAILAALNGHQGSKFAFRSMVKRRESVAIAPIPGVKPFYYLSYVSPYEPVRASIRFNSISKNEFLTQINELIHKYSVEGVATTGTLERPIVFVYNFGNEGIDLSFQFMSTLFRAVFDSLVTEKFLPGDSGAQERAYEIFDRSEVVYDRRAFPAFQSVGRNTGTFIPASGAQRGTAYGYGYVYPRPGRREQFGPEFSNDPLYKSTESRTPSQYPLPMWAIRIRLLSSVDDRPVISTPYKLNPLPFFIDQLEKVIEAYLDRGTGDDYSIPVVKGIEFSFVYVPRTISRRIAGNSIRPFRGFLNLRGYKYIHIQSRTQCLPKSIYALIKLFSMQDRQNERGQRTRKTCTSKCFFRSIENVLSREPLDAYDFHRNTIEDGLNFLYSHQRIPLHLPVVVYAANGLLCVWTDVRTRNKGEQVAFIRVRKPDESEPKLPEPHIGLIVAGNHCMPLYKESWFDKDILKKIPETSSRGERKIYKLEPIPEQVSECYIPPKAEEEMINQAIKTSNYIVKSIPQRSYQRLYMPYTKPDKRPNFNKVLALDIETTKCPSTGRVIPFLLELLGIFPDECFSENPLLGPSREDKDEKEAYYHWLVEGYSCCEILAAFLVHNLTHLDGFTIFTYNGARFDVYPVLLQLLYLTEEKNSIFIGRMIYQAGFTSLTLHKWIVVPGSNKRKLVCLHFRDLYKFTIGMSLKKACIAYKIKYLKGDMQHDEISLENWQSYLPLMIPYLKSDCRATWHLAHTFFNEAYDGYKVNGLVCPSLTSLSKKIERKNAIIGNPYLIFENSEEIDLFVRKSYFGGTTQIYDNVGIYATRDAELLNLSDDEYLCQHSFKAEISPRTPVIHRKKPNVIWMHGDRKIYDFDWTSMYPFIMAKFILPVGKGTYYDLKKIEGYNFLETEIEIYDACTASYCDPWGAIKYNKNHPHLKYRIQVLPLKKKMATVFGYVRCMVRTTRKDFRPFLTFKMKNGRNFNPYFDEWTECYLFSESIRFCMKFKLPYEFQFLEAWCFDRGLAFNGHYERLFLDKKKAAAEKNKGKKNVAKGTMNCGYGIKAIKWISRQGLKIEPYQGHEMMYLFDEERLHNVQKVGESAIIKYNERIDICGNMITMGAAITAYARMELYEFYIHVRNTPPKDGGPPFSVFYNDTDSAKTDCDITQYAHLRERYCPDFDPEDPIGHGKELGYLSNEGADFGVRYWNILYLHAPKVYCCISHDNPENERITKMKFKGYSASSWYDPKDIDYEYLAEKTDIEEENLKELGEALTRAEWEWFLYRQMEKCGVPKPTPLTEHTFLALSHGLDVQQRYILDFRAGLQSVFRYKMPMAITASHYTKTHSGTKYSKAYKDPETGVLAPFAIPTDNELIKLNFKVEKKEKPKKKYRERAPDQIVPIPSLKQRRYVEC